MFLQIDDDLDRMQSLLNLSAARHSHLCPRQVLGVRMGLAGGVALELDLPRSDKRLLAILETDGCFADGVEVATGCTVGHRTLRIEDYGKVAATFIEVETGHAIRVAPRAGVREGARLYAPKHEKRYFTQLEGYQVMPLGDLFSFQEVELATPVDAILGRPEIRVNCAGCGEEVINQRESTVDGLPYCWACISDSYYRPAALSERSPLAFVGEKV